MLMRRRFTNDNCDSENDENENMSDPRKASAEILISEQKSDRSLIHCWSLAKGQKAGYYVRDGILYRNYKYLGQNYKQLVLPVKRRQEVIKLAHEIYSGHLEAKKTRNKLNSSLLGRPLHLMCSCLVSLAINVRKRDK